MPTSFAPQVRNGGATPRAGSMTSLEPDRAGAGGGGARGARVDEVVEDVDADLLRASGPERRRDAEGRQHHLLRAPNGAEVGCGRGRPFGSGPGGQAGAGPRPPLGARRRYPAAAGPPSRPVAPVDQVREAGLLRLVLRLDAQDLARGV